MNEILKKRIEEAAINGSKHYDPNVSGYSHGKKVGYLRGFNEGAEYDLKNQWISVEEALPELMERVLVAHRGINRISICIMKRIPHDSSNPNNPEWHWSLTNHKEDVIAWMPIPELNINSQKRTPYED